MSDKRTLIELIAIGFSDIAAFFDDAGNMLEPQSMPALARRAVSSVTVHEYYRKDDNGQPVKVTEREIRLWPKLPALEAIAKIKKLLPYGNRTKLGVRVYNPSGSPILFETVAEAE